MLVVSGLFFLGYYLVMLPGGSGVSGSDQKREGDLATGKQLYADLCAACHGQSAKGRVGPDLTVSRYKYGKARRDIAKTISGGRPGGMPAFGSHINKEQIESLAEYVLSLK